MSTLETEVDPQRDGSSEPQPPASAKADRLAIQSRADEHGRHFSPDPMRRTDRYRLVTPYKLSRVD